MFEHYTLADLFANLSKKWRFNSILSVLLTLSLAVLLVGPSLGTQVVTPASNQNSAITSLYKLEIPENQRIASQASGRSGGYSDFYYYLVNHNINGPFMFDGVSDELLKQISGELGIAEQTLKNSNYELWDNKVTVSTLSDNAGIAIRLLTTSPTFNRLLDDKFSQLIEQNRNVFENVSISKVTENITGSGENMTMKSYQSNTRQIMLRLGLSIVLAMMIVILVNVVRYIFNPTINRVGDFRAYEIPFVYPIDSMENALLVIRQRTDKEPEQWVFVSSTPSVANRLGQSLPAGYRQASFDNLQEIIEASSVILVEEFAESRHQQFQVALNTLESINKKAVGVIAYK